jgi:CSLREA domain-containing protein
MKNIMLFAFFTVWLTSGYATTIHVTTTDDVVAKDGKCSLREAVQAANQNKSIDTCRAGSTSHTDVIQLGSNKYLLNFNLLDVKENLIIAGKGMAKTAISGQNRTRLFFVQPEAELQMQDLTLAQGKTTYFGGAITNSGVLTLYHCLLKQNLATGSSSAGGAIFNYGGTVNLHYAQFSENIAERGYGGGAIFNYHGHLNVENGQFLNNQANTGFGGAGIYNSEGVVNILSSSFSGNQANFGGGLFNWNGVVNIANATFSGNHASFGGAINTFDGFTHVSHATIVNNTASYGAGIDNDGQIYLSASIVLNNKSNVGAADCNNGTDSQIHTGDYNVFALDNGCGKQATDIELADISKQLDMNLSLNQAAPGTPLTHALLANSLLIDAIPAQNCRYNSKQGYYNPLFSENDRVLIDQRGAIRSYQQACDIGAYEFAATPPKKIANSPNLPSTHYLNVQVKGEGVVNSYPTGLGCDSNQTCRVAFHTGMELMLKAEPKEPYKLTAWKGDCALKADSKRLTRSLVAEVAEPPINQTVRIRLDNHKQCVVEFSR